MIDLNNHWKERGLMLEQKYIALVDCDNFFVSCERRLNPDLHGKPVCVVSGERGCVISRSQEAKQMGIPMGLPLFMAKKDFPNCIYLNAGHANYSEISNEIMTFLKNFSPYVEVYSIDEAFVDLTGLAKFYKMNYYNLAKYIRQKIMEECSVPVTIGVSRTKTLAKLSSDRAKSTLEHVSITGRCGVKKLLKQVQIGEVWGIGRRLEPKLRGHGIYTADDYVQKNDVWLKSRFGKNGLELKYELMGNLIHKIETERPLPKSISDTKSFTEFTSDLNFLKNEMMIHIHTACRKLRRADCKCSAVVVMLRTKDFQVITSKVDLDTPSNFEFEISKIAFKELQKIFNPRILYRSVGITFENFNQCEKQQLLLFQDNEKKEKINKLTNSLDKLEQKFGKNIIKTGFTERKEQIKNLSNPDII